MKKLTTTSLLFALLIGFTTAVKAQDAEQKVKDDARKVGNKSAEIGSKAKATVTDKRYEDKVGPHGETVYIDKHSKYYYVDKKGHRSYVSKMRLKDKS